MTKEELSKKIEELSKLDDNVFYLFNWVSEVGKHDAAADELVEAGRSIRKAMNMLKEQL